MRARVCLLCGGDVCGIVASLRPTLCCFWCCKKFLGCHSLRILDTPLLSKRLTCLSIPCIGHELEHLDCKTFNTDDEHVLAAEIYAIQRLSVGDPAVVRNDRRCLKLKAEALNAELDDALQSIDPLWRPAVVEDYFDCSFCENTTTQEIRRRLTVLPRAQRIRADVEGTYPPAVMRFCLQYPEAETAEYVQYVEKEKLVFEIAAPQILGFLSSEELKKLRRTVLKSAVILYIIPPMLHVLRHLIDTTKNRIAAPSHALDSLSWIDIDRPSDFEPVAKGLYILWNYSRDDSESQRHFQTFLDCGNDLDAEELRALMAAAERIRDPAVTWRDVLTTCRQYGELFVES